MVKINHHYRSYWLSLIITLYPVFIVFGQEQENNIRSLCPVVGEVGDWEPDDDPQHARGDDLYALINGGAEIYQEYGFLETIFQSYRTSDERSINLEIYKMSGPAAAYGMYTFKTGAEGVAIDVGHDGWLESYYINFWKGSYLVTLIGLDTDSLTLAGVLQIARYVDSKLAFKSDRPRITGYLPGEYLKSNGITYLKGPLALYNQYMFDTHDIFGIQEGVVGRYDDHTLFLLEYHDYQESEDCFESATHRINEIKRYSDIKLQGSQIEFVDTKKNKLIIRHFHRWIIITLSDEKIDTEKYITRQKKNLIN